MSFHPSVDDAIDTVDAMVFSGDALLDADNRKSFKEMLDRWSRGLKSAEDLAEELKNSHEKIAMVHDDALPYMTEDDNS